MLLNAPLRQESQNRCPQTDTWTAFRTGRWQIRHNKFSLTAGTKKARYPGMVLQRILLCLTNDDSWSDILLLQHYLLPRRLHFVTELRGLFFVVWINFACRRLTGHAQNNSVTTNVTGPREFICMTRYLGWNIICTLPVKIYPCFKTNMSCVWELSERTFLRSKPLSRPRIVQTDSAFHCQKSFRSYIQVAYASTNDYHTVYHY